MQKITIKTDNLKRAVSKLSHSFNSKALLPVLAHAHCRIKDSEMEMSTSDLELTGTISFEVESKADCNFLIPFGQLVQIVKVLNHDEIEFEINESSVKIYSGFDEYELVSSSKIEEFPISKLESLEMEIVLIPEVISSIKSAATLNEKSEFRPFLNSVLMEYDSNRFTIVSTNAQSLIRKYISSNLEGENSIVLSGRIVASLEELIVPTELQFNEKHILIKQLNYTLFTPQMGIRFPAYRAVIPSETDPNIFVNRDLFFQAVQKCNLISGDSKEIKISAENKDMRFLSIDANSGLKVLTKIELEQSLEETVEALISTTELLKVISEAKYKQLGIKLSTGDQKALFTTKEDANYLSLVMLRVTQN